MRRLGDLAYPDAHQMKPLRIHISMNSPTLVPVHYDVTELEEVLVGQVIQPTDNAYDSARAAWNLSVDQHPALIVIARHADDVAAAVRYAIVNDLEIAVQATGHGVARNADGSLLIVTAQMNEVVIDPVTQSAWVEAGTKWGKVLETAQAVSLAPLLGSSPTVGAVSYTLGGGMGWLARKYGLSLDSVVRFEVVTASGERVSVSEDINSDLFWGMRGAGSAFAIVTGMEIKLYPVTTVYGGTLIYAAEDAGEVLRFFREWTHYAPEEWTTSVALMNLPPLPELPPFLSGKSVVMMNGCYAGDPKIGQMMLQAWIDWKAPIASTFAPMPFANVASISNDPLDPMPGRSSGAWMANLSDDAIDTLISFTFPNGAPPTLVKTEVRHAGGVMARVESDSAAYSNRDAQYIAQMVGVTPTPAAVAAVETHIRNLKAALKPHLTGGTYLNFLESDEKFDSAGSSLAEAKLARLARLKAKYDPQNRLSRGLALPTQR